jgi:membrane-associated phospholipid phosphatase
MAEHEYWIGIPSLILSTFIGYSRIQDNMHWLHDVMAGATIGWAYGWGISRFQTKKYHSTFILPIHDSQKTGVVIYREF